MKLGITILISIGLWWVATQKAGLPETLRLRFVDYQIDLSFLGGIPFLVLIYVVLAGTTSAVNLTDGLDGLAAGCAAIVLLCYIGITFITAGQQDLALLSACLVGRAWAFCGSTRSRRRSSWATRDRSGSAARSPAWRS